MRVLFGINNDDTVKGIVSFYEEKYKEKVEYKNVYYFKQFIGELASNNYDRAIVLEELEKFPTNNYAQIDDYLFNNIDNMTDVFDSKNIIYIASDRRRLGDEFLSKLFYLGIYTVLTGQDRTKGKVCEAINTPYVKKDVKKYYNDAGSTNIYKNVEVSELEIQRIISYYKNQNGIADKYNEIFDKISTQYTNEQLKVIINFLPEDVKQYLSFNNEKYKSLLATPNFQVQPAATQDATNTTREILSKNDDAKAVEIKKEPEIIERIVVKQVSAASPVITEVVEKEVVKSVYEVPKDYKKVVCFVGAPKSGTTFCINAIGTYIAKNKIKTAIVDVTRKRDTYTIYTYDNEGKRGIAAESMKYASNGLNEPLIYDKLSIYTGTPGEDRKVYNASRCIDTIMQNNNVVLIDSDFTTPADYFRLCQEIYIVQDMDVLNIQQTTIFLRELKSRGVPMSKIRVIINKHVKCALTARQIIEGIATFSSYDLKRYDELFNPSTIPYYILPLDIENYKKYIEMLYKYSNLFSTFSLEFRSDLNKLINAIYPVGTDKNLSNTQHVKNKPNGLTSILKLGKSANKYVPADNSGFEKEIR
ncbi:MAG: hypothetical protein N2749_02705 [Clostridia bacterium]|nr:hypothetical protein [Clostridia bacterium]